MAGHRVVIFTCHFPQIKSIRQAFTKAGYDVAAHYQSPGMVILLSSTPPDLVLVQHQPEDAEGEWHILYALLTHPALEVTPIVRYGPKGARPPVTDTDAPFVHQGFVDDPRNPWDLLALVERIMRGPDDPPVPRRRRARRRKRKDG